MRFFRRFQQVCEYQAYSAESAGFWLFRAERSSCLPEAFNLNAPARRLFWRCNPLAFFRSRGKQAYATAANRTERYRECARSSAKNFAKGVSVSKTGENKVLNIVSANV